MQRFVRERQDTREWQGGLHQQTARLIIRPALLVFVP